MPSQFWTAPWTAPAAGDGTTLANSSTLTKIDGDNLLTDPRDIYPGLWLRVTAFGRISTTGTPTMLISPYWNGVGGTKMLSGASPVTCASSVTDQSWRFVADLRFVDEGATGHVIGVAALTGVASATALLPVTTPSNAAIDTTAGVPLVLGAKWSVADAANSITCHGFMVEALG